MNYSTPQEKFWAKDFGYDYIKRNLFTPKELDDSYTAKYGKTRSAINREFISKLKPKNILEIGSNVGNQLRLLQEQRYQNLYGIDINEAAVELAKKHTKNINIIKGSIFDIPFKDGYFDVVFTSGVLIHISPKDIKKAMREIYRVTRKYIWGFEYYNDRYTEVNYRDHKNRLWKADFAKLYLGLFPDLKLIKEKKYKYLTDNNVDTAFLLEKK